MSLKKSKGKRAKIVPIGTNDPPAETERTVTADAAEFLKSLPAESVRGVMLVVYLDEADACKIFGEVTRKDQAFMGAVLTAEAIGLDTGE